jgi:hypothetical protein
LQLVYLHIPKTAGSSVRDLFQKKYWKRHVLFVDGYSPDSFIAEHVVGKNLHKKKLIFGHFDIGISKHLESDVQFMTILRDPIERVISHYYYVLRMKGHYLHKYVIDNNLSLKEYVEQGLTNELNNGQVRILMGAGGYHKDAFSLHEVEYGKCEDWMLEMALKNIEEKFIFVGFQEEMEKSMKILGKKLKWRRIIQLHRENRTENRPMVDDLDEETIKVIRKFNALDIQLYEVLIDKFRQA